MQRQGNTLSTVVRDAWDCRQVLETLTKKEPTKATKPFISIGGHITLDELQREPRPHSDGERLCQPLSDGLHPPQQRCCRSAATMWT